MILNEKNNNISFSSINYLKDISPYIPILKSSLKYQKDLMKDIERKIEILINDEILNKNNPNIKFINDYLELFITIMKQFGIPVAHNFLFHSNILQNLCGLYFDKNEKYGNKIKKIFVACLEVFDNIFSNNKLNEIREYLNSTQIIQIQEETRGNEPKDDEIIYENIYDLLNGLKDILDIKDREKLSELEDKYKSLKQDLKIFQIKNREQPYQAELEFFNELILDIDKKFKEISSSKINEKNIEINLNNIHKIEEIDIPLHKRTSFYLNEKIKEQRNEVIEFKSYSLPLANNKERDDIKRQICGFLNSKGGRLYLGINSQNEVKGIVLDSKTRDICRNDLVNLTYDFYPNCRTDKIFVDFIPIKDMFTKEFKSKRFVVKIRVYPGNPEYLYSMCKVGYHSTIRRGNQCYELNSTEIYDQIVQRDELKKIKNQDNNIIIEANIRDPSPEKNNHDDDKEEIDELPFFGKDSLNISDDVKRIIKEKGKRPRKKNKKNMVRDGTITVKVTNIDENIPSNDVNRMFNGCRCASQKMLNGHGFLNFSNINDANNCIARFNGKLVGNKRIKLNIINNN